MNNFTAADLTKAQELLKRHGSLIIQDNEDHVVCPWCTHSFVPPWYPKPKEFKQYRLNSWVDDVESMYPPIRENGHWEPNRPQTWGRPIMYDLLTAAYAFDEQMRKPDVMISDGYPFKPLTADELTTVRSQIKAAYTGPEGTKSCLSFPPTSSNPPPDNPGVG